MASSFKPTPTPKSTIYTSIAAQNKNFYMLAEHVSQWICVVIFMLADWHSIC